MRKKIHLNSLKKGQLIRNRTILCKYLQRLKIEVGDYHHWLIG